MPILLQINVTANWGSTGKIAEAIGRSAMKKGWESYYCLWTHDEPIEQRTYQGGVEGG